MPGEPLIKNVVPAGTPAVHALVLGVGHYSNGEVPALDGAAPSALAFADWVAHKLTRPGLAIGSVDVLASQPSGAPVSCKGSALAPPTLTNVQDAVEGWNARASEDRSNVAVFYFCGHGIELGGLQSLLLGDVRLASLANPFGRAIAFTDFLHGMDCCGARQQLFVVDACRDLPANLARWDDKVPLGDPLIRFHFPTRAKLPPRVHVILQAAASTQKAWAAGERGWFTDALLAVLEGAAANNRFSVSGKEYTVSTRDIADTIDFLVKHDFCAAPAGPQTPVRAGEGDFDLHRPAVPTVPVVVTRKPPSTNTGALFVAEREGAEVASHACPDERPWRSRLEIGSYVFRCGPDEVSEAINVPARKVLLP